MTPTAVTPADMRRVADWLRNHSGAAVVHVARWLEKSATNVETHRLHDRDAEALTAVLLPETYSPPATEGERLVADMHRRLQEHAASLRGAS